MSRGGGAPAGHGGEQDRRGDDDIGDDCALHDGTLRCYGLVSGKVAPVRIIA
jgi:hypothetical protein